MLSSARIGRTARLLSQRARLFCHSSTQEGLVIGRKNNRYSPIRHSTSAATRYEKYEFSTDAIISNANNDLNAVGNITTMDDKQLKQLALKYSRQDNPTSAHVILEQLKLNGSSKQILSEVGTSVIDSWIKYQNKYHTLLKEAILNNDTARVQSGHLEEICYGAERASQILDSMENPSPHHFVAVLKVWANACKISSEAELTKLDFVRGIPQRAQHLLDLQENPTVESYNQVLKAWAHSREYLRGTMAELLFQKIDEPNGESFKSIIRAWCWSKERRCAFTATGHFMRMMRLLETGRSDMEPSMDDFHELFRAWTRAEDKNAPSKVQTVLQIIENGHKKGLIKHGADESCFRDALITMSRRVNVPEVGELADTTLGEMKDAMLIPDTACYSAAILAWKNVATARECEDRERASGRALELLHEMTKAYHRTTKVTVKPTTKDYNHVLEALTVSKSSKAPQHAETLLNALEDASSATNTFIGPNAESYKYALAVWRNSKSANKVPFALGILQRFKDRINVGDIEFGSNESFVEVFSTFIDVCAHSGAKKDSRKIMTLALRTVEDMKSHGLHPDSTTYTALLGACHNLIADGHERQKILENIFTKACEEGYVDQHLLEQFKQAASTYLFAKAVISHSREIEGMKVVPESWTRQAKGFLVNTKGGRQVLPLSIDGKFTFTKAAAEYKMRKLRRRQNKKMLQGGRMMT